MGTLLDILQSVIIGGMIFLMLLFFNFNMHSVSEDVISNTQVQSDIVAISSILENDFIKIGYHETGDEKIQVAKLNEIKFLSDIDNNGTVDSIKYYLSDTLEVKETTNPSDKNLYRKLNNSHHQVVGRVIDFSLTYYDSTGNLLSYSQLLNSSARKKISEIGMNLNIESAIMLEEKYSASKWNKKIRIKNLN
ncbi:MAG: hypothetical protein H6612_04735 [Ignavibacteriales bacterium]|nr:hypothetical protein [Ignavibacteriales bacterium]MCB9258641.1 hypothetical protein [Ignavibacteriales bacterium]